MAWIKKEMPLIQGYESLGDTVASKFWVDQKLNEWLDTGDPVFQFAHKFKTRKEICDFIIKDFEYPLRFGVPDDKHTYNAFSGKRCYTISADYWAPCSETLRTLVLEQRKSGANAAGMANCEDSSIAFVTLFLQKRWKAFECLGAVYSGAELLGYHGWAKFRSEGGEWRLYESTLNVPPNYPEGYPKIDPEDTKWNVNGLTYKAFCRFNRHEYYESGEGDLLTEYLKQPFKSKETRMKYEAIAKAWHQKTKPLQAAKFVAKLRWRK